MQAGAQTQAAVDVELQGGAISGGLGRPAPSAREQELLLSVKDALLKKLKSAGKPVSATANIEAVTFRVQVVAGFNYFMKVRLPTGYVHVRIFVPLPYSNKPPVLSAVQHNKKLEDPIDYFN